MPSAVSDESGVDVQWQVRVPGDPRGVACVLIDDDQILVADGWGVAFTSARLSLLDRRDGHERASVRMAAGLGGAVLVPDGLYVVNDKRLSLHDPQTLTERESWRGVPRGSRALVWHLGRLWIAGEHGLGIFDPATGSVSRRRSSGAPFPSDDGMLLVDSAGTLTLVPVAGKTRHVADVAELTGTGLIAPCWLQPGRTIVAACGDVRRVDGASVSGPHPSGDWAIIDVPRGSVRIVAMNDLLLPLGAVAGADPDLPGPFVGVDARSGQLSMLDPESLATLSTFDYPGEVPVLACTDGILTTHPVIDAPGTGSRADCLLTMHWVDHITG